MNNLILKIKRRETPFYAKLYDIIQGARKGGIPSIKFIHKPLYIVSRILIGLRWAAQEKLWAIPIFKTLCRKYGKNLSLPNGIPWITSNHLVIDIGDDVTIMKSTFLSGHTYDEPVLKIGNKTTIGYNTMISVGERVEIGNNVMIAHNCFIADNDGHPIDPKRRLNHEAVKPEEIKPVKIGNNVWIGANCSILKGAEIGDNVVVSPNSVIASTAIPDKIFMGNPARAVKAI